MTHLRFFLLHAYAARFNGMPAKPLFLIEF